MTQLPTSNASSAQIGLDIAIIGMAGRFPGARSVDEFWRNLKDGVESISFFSDQDLLAAGVDPAVFNAHNYVRAGGVLEGIELFDASFFGFTPREAEIIDPQQRLFLECAWEALESAGYDPGQYRGSIGVYAGAGMNAYLLDNLFSNHELMDSLGPFQIMILSDKDFLTTRVSYKLNLKGPAITVQTACSTSLVAVHQACQSLLNYQCDMSLAGGISILSTRKMGYFYQEGMILSPDGHCRAFDAKAQGTVPGAGVGIVVLKRLDDAIADGDHIYAVIKGTAINNDGSLKVGFTAPSVDGQAEVIAMAQAVAGVSPESIGYIEAHGTGTSLGDPIEMAGLTKAFHAHTQKKGFCAIGSVKTNIGHTDAAAGVAGVIKTVQALRHKLIPPSLHFSEPNPKIDFANSPFYVNTALSEWPSDGTPRRAAVSSFGIGGTNAHAILEEAPLHTPSSESRPAQLLVLSAKTGAALEAASKNLLEHLKHHPEFDFADVAYTLQVGRRVFDHRRMLVCGDREDAIGILESSDSRRIFTAVSEASERPVVFMFPGQGSQYVNMGLDLYRTEAVFREQIDLCSQILTQHLGLDLRDVLYPRSELHEDGIQRFQQTAITQPALFVVEYALARLMMDWGVKPQAMIGHSIGEFVAACLADVFSLEDALALVGKRAQLMNQLPAGSMLAVPLPPEEVSRLLGPELSLAAANGPSLSVVSGPTEAIGQLEKELGKRGLESRRLHTSHAFHSKMTDPILEQFADQIKIVKRAAPKIPYLSNVSGTWITAAEATDPYYWTKHLRQTVRFAEGVHELLRDPAQVLLEIGPGQTLSSLAKQQADRTVEQVVLSSMRHPRDFQTDEAFLINVLGKLWLAGTKIDWTGFYAKERRLRLPLPTYPFERQRYWVDPKKPGSHEGTRRPSLGKKSDIADWFYVPSWKRSRPQQGVRQDASADRKTSWLVFMDEHGLGHRIIKRLEEKGETAIGVKTGEKFAKAGEALYTVNPRARDDYDFLIKELRAKDMIPNRIVHLWSVTQSGLVSSGVESFEETLYLGFYSLLFLARALAEQHVTTAVQIDVISNQMQEVDGEALIRPEKATVLGPCKVISQEYTNIICRSIDIDPTNEKEAGFVDRLMAELCSKPNDLVVAYRGKHRWTQIFEPIRLEERPEGVARLRDNGIYLITGGLGNIGLALAEYLAETVKAKLILVGRSTLPSGEQREKYLQSHGDQDSLSLKIRRVQAMEEEGAEVLIVSADAADQEQMAGALAEATQRFGAIHGVIHAAGVVDQNANLLISEATPESCGNHFRAKVYGLMVLEKLLRGRRLDFCLLTSSISTVLGGLGFSAYAAANHFMDAFAYNSCQTSGVAWISVNYDGWNFMEKTEPGFGEALARLALTPQEGVETFKRVLSLDTAAQVIVSTGDLQARIDQWVKLESLRGTERPREQESVASSSLHSRPNLSSPYTAPGNETEQAVAEIWQNLFGLEQVGVHDDFFELGGHSLLAMQVVSRIRNALQVGLPLTDLFEKPTVAGLADRIDTIRWASQGIARDGPVSDRAEIEF